MVLKFYIENIVFIDRIGSELGRWGIFGERGEFYIGLGMLVFKNFYGMDCCWCEL